MHGHAWQGQKCMHGCVVMNNFIITAKQIIMLCSKFTQLEMLVKIAHCSQVMARLEDTEKRHNMHMVRTIRVCLYRTRMVRKIVPYTYGMYHTRMVHTIRVRYKIRIWHRTISITCSHQ